MTSILAIWIKQEATGLSDRAEFKSAAVPEPYAPFRGSTYSCIHAIHLQTNMELPIFAGVRLDPRTKSNLTT